MSTWELIGVMPSLTNIYCQILSSHFNFASGVTLGPIPDWIKKDRILENLSWTDRNLIKSSLFSFRYLYESDGIGSKQRDSEDILKFASMAFWIAKPLSCGINANLHFDSPDGKSKQRSATWGDQLLSHPKDNQEALEEGDLQLAKILHEKLIEIPINLSTLRTAINLLWRALIDPWWQTRYLCMWVALESLFGPDQPQEISYRISYRCTAFLSQSKDEAKQLFEKIKKGYRWRSKVVHGSQLNKLTPEISNEISHNVETLLRKTFIKLLLSNELINHFNGKDRDKYLDNLILEALWIKAN